MHATIPYIYISLYKQTQFTYEAETLNPDTRSFFFLFFLQTKKFPCRFKNQLQQSIFYLAKLSIFNLKYCCVINNKIFSLFLKIYLLFLSFFFFFFFSCLLFSNTGTRKKIYHCGLNFNYKMLTESRILSAKDNFEAFFNFVKFHVFRESVVTIFLHFLSILYCTTKVFFF